jgi:hypothetical protein
MLGAHRALTVDPTEPPAADPRPAVPPPRPVYSRDDARRAWARRRADLDHLAGIDDVLDEIEARAKELQHRTAAVLAAEDIP